MLFNGNAVDQTQELEHGQNVVNDRRRRGYEKMPSGLEKSETRFRGVCLLRFGYVFQHGEQGNYVKGGQLWKIIGEPAPKEACVAGLSGFLGARVDTYVLGNTWGCATERPFRAPDVKQTTPMGNVR
jgi:hypothetical protein